MFKSNPYVYNCIVHSIHNKTERETTMASQRPDTPERIASVETAVQYLSQSQVQSDKRFDRLEDKVDRLDAKVDRVLFTIIAVGTAIFAAVIASNWLG